MGILNIITYNWLTNLLVNQFIGFINYYMNIEILSPLRKLTYFIKLVISDEIFIFRNSVMPEHQLVEKTENIAKRDFFDCVSFRSGLNFK